MKITDSQRPSLSPFVRWQLCVWRLQAQRAGHARLAAYLRRLLGARR